jgi:hypothetical protein
MEKESIAIGISLLALIIAGFSAYYTYDQDKIIKDLNYFHVDPKIECILNYPQNDLPIVIIKNKSPIKIVSFGLSHTFYEFNKESKNISLYYSVGNTIDDFAGENAIFEHELDPHGIVYMSLPKLEQDGHHPKDMIFIYLFDISYYRATDMKYYSERRLYFVDNGTIYNHSEFLKTQYYNNIMDNIDKYSPKRYDNWTKMENLAEILSIKKNNS